MITAHAKVRFIERCVDQSAVKRERKAGLNDHMILAKIHASYARELDEYGSALEQVVEAWTVRQALPNKFKVRAGAAVAVINNGVCVTTIRRRRHEPVPRSEARRRHKHSEDY